MAPVIPVSVPGGPEIDADSYEQLRFGQLVRRMATSSLVLTIGTFALRLSGFLLIPIYWRYLDPADYGIIAVAEMVKTFLMVFLGLGFSESITAFYYRWPVNERRDRLGTVWSVDWLSSLVIGVPIALWGAPLFGLVVRQVPFDPYLRLAVWTAVFMSFSASPLMTLRIAERSGLYISCGLAAFAAQTTLAMVLVVGMHRGSLGFLQAQLGGAVLMIPVYVIVMGRWARPVVRRGYLRECITFSLPLVPSGLSDALMAITSRFVLEKYVTLSTLGLFSVGESLGGIVRIVFTALKTAWMPFEMRAAAERTDAPQTIGRMATFFSAAIVVFAVALASLSQDGIHLIGVSKYAAVANLVPLFVVTNIILAVGSFVAGGLWIARKSEYSLLISITHLVATILAHVLLVPSYGVYGAIAATAISMLCRAALGYALAQRFYYIPFQWGRLAAIMGGALLTCALAFALPSPPSLIGTGGRVALVAVFSFAVAYFALDARRMTLSALVAQLRGTSPR